MVTVDLPFDYWATATAVYPVVFRAKRFSRLTRHQQDLVMDHEEVHLEQQRQWFVRGLGVGLLAWFLLYLLVLPAGWNPFRERWEREAYIRGSKIAPDKVAEILRKAPYWIIWPSRPSTAKVFSKPPRPLP